MAPFAGQAVVVALVALGAIGLGLVALAVDSVSQRSVLVARPQQGQGRIRAQALAGTESPNKGFGVYANSDPYAQPGDEPDADKFNARALRSMQALMKRAKRLQKIVKALSKDVGTKELDVNLSPRGPIGPVGGPGPVGPISVPGPRGPTGP